VSLSVLDAARASYLWELRSQRPLVTDQLADLSIAFRWLLSLHLDEATPPLVQARAVYVAALHTSMRDLEEEIAELASLYARLVSAELDRAAALMPPAPPGAERCAPASARASRSR
jgi:hypothetical protein